MELGLQFIYHGLRLLLDGWLVFDLIIIVTSWSFASIQIIRAFRIFRALRLVTRIKILKHLVLGTFCRQNVSKKKREICTRFNLTSSFFIFHPKSFVWCHATNGCNRIDALFDFLHFWCYVHSIVQGFVCRRTYRLQLFQ